MRPPNALGKSTANASQASFLRRTEYITSSTAGSKNMFESSTSSNTMRLRKKRAKGNVHEDDPIHITRNILKGFNLAYPEDAYTGPDTTENLRPANIDVEETRAWKNPKNPHNEKLELIDSYPLLPDWDAIPDTGSYAMFKFVAAPVKDASSASTYDPRLDVSILRLAGETIEDRARFAQEQELYKQDPSMHPPLPWFHYEFFLPSDRAKVSAIKRNFSTYNPDAADLPFDETVDEDGRPRKFFRYENVRTYETQSQVSNLNDRFGDTVALALHDPKIHREGDKLREGELPKGAYFYPIGQKSHIRPRRPGKVHLVEEFPKIDYLEASGREPDEEEVRKREAERRVYDVEGGEV